MNRKNNVYTQTCDYCKKIFNHNVTISIPLNKEGSRFDGSFCKWDCALKMNETTINIMRPMETVLERKEWILKKQINSTTKQSVNDKSKRYK